MSENQNYITQKNYEEWFMDYLDGQMHQERERLLFEFLNHNPHLKAELYSLQTTFLTKPELVSYPNKHILFKSVATGIDFPETDFLLVKKMEEGLTNQETLRLEELTKRFPALTKDELLYKKTILLAPGVVYSKKKSLVRKQTGWMWPLTQGVIAAAVLLTIILQKGGIYQFEAPPVENQVYSEAKINEPENISDQERLVASTKKTPENPDSKAKLAKDVGMMNRNKDSEIIFHQTFYNTTEAVELISAPEINIQVSTLQVDAYEKGLATLIPTYIKNQRIQDAQDFVPDEAHTQNASLLDKGTGLINRLTQKELAFRKVYDSEGNVVAVNVKSGDFEMSQRLPRWLGR